MIKIKNPYNELIKLMKDSSKIPDNNIKIGEVISVEPFVIKIGELQLDKDNLLVADYLINNYIRQISIPKVSASGSAGEHSISSISIPRADMKFTNSLKKGDKVAVLSTVDRQTFIILCKAVKL